MSDVAVPNRPDTSTGATGSQAPARLGRAERGLAFAHQEDLAPAPAPSDIATLVELANLWFPPQAGETDPPTPNR